MTNWDLYITSAATSGSASSSSFRLHIWPNRCSNGDLIVCRCRIADIVRCLKTPSSCGRYFYSCMNWNKSHRCNFFKWTEEVKCDEIDDGRALLILICKQVETLGEDQWNGEKGTKMGGDWVGTCTQEYIILELRIKSESTQYYRNSK